MPPNSPVMVTGLVTPRRVSSPSSSRASPSTRRPVETKVIVGYWSMAKKSLVRRWASRSAFLVLIEAMSTVTSTRESCGFSAAVTVASNVSKTPLTLLMARWRTLKPISVWA